MKATSYKIQCPYDNCGQHIEFPAELLNTKAQCPSCNRSVWLSLDKSQPTGMPEKKNLMPWIVAGCALILCAVFAGIAFKAINKKSSEVHADSQAQASTSPTPAQSSQANHAVSSPNNDGTIKIITIHELSYNEGKTKQFPCTVNWTVYQLPKNQEAKSACKDIVSELKQISKVLELGITYDRFCDLLQEKTLAIEKIKDKAESVPTQFLKHVDDCIGFYKISRDGWKTEIESAEFPDLKASAAFHRLDCWTLAKVQELYCVGIAENNPEVSDAIMTEMASSIYSDQTIVIPHAIQQDKKLGLGDSELPHPVLSKMTAEQIFAQVKQMAASATN